MSTQIKTTAQSWVTSKDAVPEGFTQITVYSEETGERIATVFDAEAVPVITASRELLEALQACREWMEFTIEQLGTHDKGARLNWGGPMHKARAAIARATEGNR